MRRLTFLLFSLILGIGLLHAQTKVSGTVLSAEDGQPIVGAAIMAKGTTVGTVTDYDGKFSLNVPAGVKILKFTYVGMNPLEEAVKPNMIVKMTSSSEALDEVVVMGYGSAKKIGSLVGAVSTVNSETLKAKPSANAMDALQGKVTGMQVYTSSGEPGAVSSSFIRGVGSLTAGTEPLYVLDGSPVNSSIMVSMNPNDIESVTVLKDASATSIYGSRAANGVIYVTSKKGRVGTAASISASGTYGVSSLARRISNPMNSDELLDYRLGHGTISQETYDKYKSSGVNTDWQKYFFNDNAPTYQANLSITGGSEKTSYYVSGSLYSQDGITPRSELTKYTFRTNLDSSPTKWLKFGTRLGFTYDDQQTSLFTYQGSNSLSGGIFGTILTPSYFDPYAEDGSKLDFIPGFNRYSPYYLSEKQPSSNNKASLNGNVYLQFMPIENLIIKSQVAMDAYDFRQTSKRLPSHPQATNGGYTFEGFRRNVNLSIANTVEYSFDINDVHDFTVLLAQEGVKTNYERFATQTEGQNDDRLTMLEAGTKALLLSADENDLYEYRYLSFFGRVNYNYKNKYYADFTVRNDASSRFGKNNRDATFFSGGVMWNLKQEDFLSDVDYLSNLKFKASIGTTGNSDIGNYNQYSLVGTNLYNTNGGWYVSYPGDKNLSWEKVTMTNIGVEFGFWDRLRMDLTYYIKNTDDMLMDVPVPYTTGFDFVTKNVGSMSNKGVELSLSYDLVKSRDWNVNIYANYSYNKNKITKLFYDFKEWPMPNYLIGYVVGEPVQFYMPKWAGVNSETGEQEWYVPGTDEKTNVYNEEKLQQVTGKPRYAPHNGGFGLNVSWKGLSLGADFAWVLGKYMVNNDYFFAVNPYNFASFNQSKDVLTEWKNPGDITTVPKYGSIMQFDTHLLENASFMRLKNLSVAYSFPQSLLSRTKVIKGIKIIGTARNLFTVTKYKGADPELNTNLTYGAYPNTKQFTIGAELTF